ncbi:MULTISPECIES: NADPH:quinone oxidoreductase family protein [unclassified Mycobacterium]|uniref:NADPH:quinone oxidoreductase family protein n=1 Tax=unclassified Mycobacterium TaxID=2642494 RepID=UPI0029C7B9FC|nr:MULTISPECIES: NADPH:quinone oxidoreductase family protein [unclassified Mycobacterium]
MKAVRVVRHGDPTEALEVQDVPPPEVGPGEVRIAVSAASLNFGDIARCRGTVASVMGQVPFTLGMDVCGVVDEAGEGATEWVGRRVVAMAKQSLGGLAEFAIAPATGTFDAPPDLDDASAAAFTLPFHVGYLALHRRARLIPGETLLVVGGASAVGTAVIQLGVAAGANVIAIAGGPEKGRLCEELGASAIDHTAADLFDEVNARTDGRGADVAVDLVGGEQTETIWTCMAREGRYVPVGFNDDPQSGLTGRPLRKVSMGNISVLGVILGYGELPVDFRRFGLNMFPAEVGREVHDALLELVASGAIRPVIGRQITMDQVGEALHAHEQRQTTGRTVVTIARG